MKSRVYPESERIGSTSTPPGEQRHGYTFPLRVLLVVVGLHSGKNERRTLTVISTVYQLICCILPVVMVITAFGIFITFLSTTTPTVIDLLLPISGLHWHFTQTLSNCIFFYVNHKEESIHRFYDAMKDITDEMRRLGVGGNPEKERKYQTAIWVTTAIMGLVNMGIKIWDLSTNNIMDPIFGSGLLPNYTFPTGYSIFIQCVSYSVPLLTNIQWMYHPALFVSTCCTVWMMLVDFNQHLKQQIKEDANKILLNVKEYRSVHLKLCQLIQKVDGLFNFYLGNTFSNIVVGLLISLYMMALARDEPRHPLEHFTLTFWLSTYAANLFLFIFFSQKLEAESGAAYEDILNVADEYPEVTVHQSHQIQMFISKTRNPESVTMAGLMIINKDLGLTIVSVMVTYYLVMVQFNG